MERNVTEITDVPPSNFGFALLTSGDPTPLVFDPDVLRASRGIDTEDSRHGLQPVSRLLYQAARRVQTLLPFEAPD